MRTKRNQRGTTIRLMQVILALVIAVVVMPGNASATVEPISERNKEALRIECEAFGGIFTDRGAAGFSCYLNGILVECDAGGTCLTWCYVAMGCTCEDKDLSICIHPFTPGDDATSWDDAIHLDPYQEAKLPEESSPEPSSPVSVPEGVVIDDGQVMKPIDPVADPAPDMEPDPAPTVIEDAPAAPILTTR